MHSKSGALYRSVLRVGKASCQPGNRKFSSAGQGNRRPWLLLGRGFRYGVTSKPNQAITSDQEIPWFSGRPVVGFVATTAVGRVVAMVALVATEPTLVATEPTLVATEATLGVTKATQADWRPCPPYPSSVHPRVVQLGHCLICYYGLCESPSAAYVYDALLRLCICFCRKKLSLHKFIGCLALQPGQSAWDRLYDRTQERMFNVAL
jgi:hypothetical protein